jgi:hypothetical protein
MRGPFAKQKGTSDLVFSSANSIGLLVPSKLKKESQSKSAIPLGLIQSMQESVHARLNIIRLTIIQQSV